MNMYLRPAPIRWMTTIWANAFNMPSPEWQIGMSGIFAGRFLTLSFVNCASLAVRFAKPGFAIEKTAGRRDRRDAPAFSRKG